MLNIHDLVGFSKAAQLDDQDDGNFTSFSRPTMLPTLGDLVQAIQADRGLSSADQAKVLAQLRALVGFSQNSTPISALMYQGLGGILGALISKYFGMGRMGQIMSAAAGFGIGTVLNNKLNRPPDPYRGYKMIGHGGYS